MLGAALEQLGKALLMARSDHDVERRCTTVQRNPGAECVRIVREADVRVRHRVDTCEICQAGYQTSCLHRQPIGAIGTLAECARIPLADGTLVATPGVPADDLVPSLLAASDVLGTGWFAALGSSHPAAEEKLSLPLST